MLLGFSFLSALLEHFKKCPCACTFSDYLDFYSPCTDSLVMLFSRVARFTKVKNEHCAAFLQALTMISKILSCELFSRLASTHSKKSN